MPVEEQVVQVYAATNGYLDRVLVEKVDRFLADLTDYMRGNESDLLGKIAGGDWSDETQKAIESAVSSFAEDFGFDLDEEGHPIDEDGDERSGDRSREDQDQDRGGEEEDQAEAA
jgi:F-type H+-transporting ATPase subunit alpha